MSEGSFMTKLEKQLEGLSKKTIEMYMTKLRILNGGKPFKSLAFIKNTVNIKEKLDSIANDNTRKSYVASIVAVLNRQTDAASKKANEKYKTMFAKERSIFAEKQSLGEKSETQKENWMSQDEIRSKHKELADKVDAIENKTKLTEKERKLVEDWFLLSLYVLQPPRRNADYYLMKFGMGEDKNFNYVCLEKGVYKFNNFKTSKGGPEEIKIPDDMKSVIKQYLEITGLKAGDFILFGKDTRRTSSNSITKALNRILGKRVGASMLRHIYLTDKYGEVKDEQKKDAEFMSHSVDTAQSYIVK
jgi:hypothetical protein